MSNLTYQIKSDDAVIYTQVSGEGMPLVLLHGNAEDLHYFDQQIPLFSENFKVIAIDTRAHGRSSDGIKALDFHLFAQDIIAVMDFLHIDKAHILGFSDGGNLALHLALTYPERIISLILNGANLSPKGEKTSIWVMDILYYAFCSIFAPFNAKISKQKKYLSLMVKHPHLMPSQLSAILQPTLVIAGENDMIKTSHTKLIADSIPNAQLVIVPNADHFVAKKQPKVFNGIILKFLKSLSGQ